MADGGPDRDVLEDTEVVLSAAGSSDRDGRIASYAWSQVTGDVVTLSSPSAADTSFTAPATDAMLTLEFLVEVTDDEGASSTDTVAVHVFPDVPPVVAVLFPPPSSRFFGDRIDVSGTVVDVAGTPGMSIVVSGGSEDVDAVVDEDGGWIAQVPLAPGAQAVVLTATAVDWLGSTASTEVSFENLPTMSSALVELDPAHPDVVYAFEDFNLRLLAIDLSTGERAVLSQVPWGDVGWGGALDTAGHQVLVFLLDAGGPALCGIDLETGALRTISSATTGTGPAFDGPNDLAVDAAHGQAIVTDWQLNAVFRIDLATGNRAIVSDNSGAGTGDPFEQIGSVALDASHDKAYVYDFYRYAIIEVDLATGARSVLSGSGVGAGPALVSVGEMSYDADAAAIAVLGATNDDVMTVDVATGDRVMLSAAGTSGISLGSPRGLRVDTAHDRYVVSDFYVDSGDLDAIVGVDRQTGARTVLLEEQVGSGPQLEFVDGIAIDADLGEAYVTSSDALIAIDLQTGDRLVVSGAGVGSGEPLDVPWGLALDAPGGRVFVADRGSASVFEVDLVNGARTVVASATVGAGPALQDAIGVVYLPGAQPQLVVLDPTSLALLRVDLTTLTRSILSDSGTGTGTAFVGPVDIALDIEHNRLLVADEGDGGTYSLMLLGVDLTTGDRAELARGGTGVSAWGLTGVAMVPGSESAVVTDGELVRLVDLATGSGVDVAGDSLGRTAPLGAGETLRNVMRLAVDEKTGLVYGGSVDDETLLAIDPRTGDRVIVSK